MLHDRTPLWLYSQCESDVTCSSWVQSRQIRYLSTTKTSKTFPCCPKTPVTLKLIWSWSDFLTLNSVNFRQNSSPTFNPSATATSLPQTTSNGYSKVSLVDYSLIAFQIVIISTHNPEPFIISPKWQWDDLWTNAILAQIFRLLHGNTFPEENRHDRYIEKIKLKGTAFGNDD